MLRNRHQVHHPPQIDPTPAREDRAQPGHHTLSTGRDSSQIICAPVYCFSDIARESMHRDMDARKESQTLSVVGQERVRSKE